MKQIIDMWDVLEKLCFVSHITACIWMYIGYLQLTHDLGWIYNNNQAGIQKIDYWSIYTTSLYWVIASFTSVGYGDVKGHTNPEYIYQIFVEMIGIAFYGYMLGMF